MSPNRGQQYGEPIASTSRCSPAPPLDKLDSATAMISPADQGAQPTVLTVKTPNQTVSDQQLSVDLNWTVLDLKRRLQDIYPSHPKPEEQRLIYGGRLLENLSTLKEAFRHDEVCTSYTLHMVCRSTEPPKLESNSELRRRQNVASAATSTTTLGDHLGTNSLPNFQTFFAANQGLNAVPPHYQAYQQQAFAYWWTQQYAAYLAQYHAAVAATAATATASGNVPPQISPTQQQQPQPDRRPVINVQGGQILEEDEEGQRDWLDYMHTFCRVFVIFMLVYFYSSFGRFLLVTGFAFLVYLYQSGWFQIGMAQGGQAEVNVNPPHEAAAAPANIGEQPNNIAAADNVADINELQRIMDGDRDHRSNVAVNEPTASRLGMAWTVLTTFFSSMIPEAVPVD